MKNVSEKMEEQSLSSSFVTTTTHKMGVDDVSNEIGYGGVAENNELTFWETLINPKKLFPTLDPLAGVIVYVAIVLLFVIFILLLIWIITAWCLECKAKRKKHRYHSNLLGHDLFSRSMSSFGSVGSLSTVTSSSYGTNSLSKLVKSPKQGKKSKKHRESQLSHLRPLSCSAGRCPSCTAFDINRKKQIKKAKSHTEKSQLLRNPSLYQANHSSFLQRNPSYLSGSSSLEKGMCKNCYTETCFGRSCELPRANWDGENIINFIRDHALGAHPESPAPDYASLVGNFATTPELKSTNSENFKENADMSNAELNGSVENKSYENNSEFPPPPSTKI